MANITVPPIILRTTSDQAGHAHGVVLGEGMSAAAALLDLENKGGRRPEEVAAGFSDRGGADATWPFQVVGVTLIPVPPEAIPGARPARWSARAARPGPAPTGTRPGNRPALQDQGC